MSSPAPRSPQAPRPARPPRRRRSALALAARSALAALLATGAAAEAQTWTGMGLSNNWSDPLNWQGLSLPLSSSSTAITFSGSSRPNTVQNLGAPFTLNALTFASSAAGFAVSGNALRFAGPSASFVQNTSNAVTLSVPTQIVERLVYSGNGSAVFRGPLSSGNADPQFRPELVKRGSGRLTLTEASSFSGLVRIEAGQLRIENAQALPQADVTLAVDNGLDLSGVSSVALGGLSGTGALALGTTQLTLGGSNSSPAIYGGHITATTGTVTKVGSGVAEFGGTSSLAALQVDRGGVVLRGGAMTLDHANQGLRVGTGGAAAPGTVATLELRDGARLSALGRTVQVDGASATELRVVGSGSRLDTGFQMLVGNFGTGTLRVGDGGRTAADTFLIMGFNNGSTGTLEVQAGGGVGSAFGLLGVGTGSAGTATVSGSGARWDNAALGIGGFNADLRGGTGMLTVGPGGVVTASDHLTFWSAASRVTVDGGQLRVGRLESDGAVGTVQLRADGAAGAALVIDGAAGTAIFAGALTGPGTVQKLGAGTQVLSGAGGFTGAVRVFGGTLELPGSAAGEYEVRSGAQLRLGERSLGAAVVHAMPGGTVTYTAPTLNGGLLLGAGTHDIAAVQRLIGTQLANGVELRPAAGTVLLGVANSGRIVNAGGQSLGWSGGSNPVGTLSVAGITTVGGFSSGGVIEVLPGGILTNVGTDLLLSGGSRATIGSAVAPGGTLRLPDASRVQLNGGLLVNNGTLDGALVVNFGGLAKGGGSFGAVTVTDGGRFSPGNSPGTARSASATWGAGGSYLVELAAAEGTAGEHWDLWQIDGLLEIAAGTTANSRFTLSLLTLDAGGVPGPLAGFDPMRAWSWQIAEAGAGITGFDLARLTLDTRGFGSDTAGGSFTLALRGGNIHLHFAPVPEPGTWALWLAGLAGVGAVAARRRERA